MNVSFESCWQKVVNVKLLQQHLDAVVFDMMHSFPLNSL